MRAFLIGLLLTIAPPAMGGTGPHEFLAAGVMQTRGGGYFFARTEAPPCPAGMRRALWAHNDIPYVVFGCWRLERGKVEAVFEDEDVLTFDPDEITWLPGGRPEAL